MGASADYEEIELNVSNPRSQSEVKTATKEAWNDLVKERGYQYGHRGYTGTFAEKYGVVISYFPQLNDEEIENLATLVSQDFGSQDNLRKFLERYDSVWLKPYLSNEKFNLTSYSVKSPILEKRNPQYVAKAKQYGGIKMLKPNPDWRNAIVTIEKFQEKMPMPFNKFTKELADALSIQQEKQDEKWREYTSIYNEIKNLRKRMRGESKNASRQTQREIWRLEKLLPHRFNPDVQPSLYGLKYVPEIAELTNSPTYLKMKKMQKSYPLLYGGRKIVGYQSAFKKADISYYNLERMTKQWDDKHGSALAITNGSIVIFMGMCSS